MLSSQRFFCSLRSGGASNPLKTTVLSTGGFSLVTVTFLNKSNSDFFHGPMGRPIHSNVNSMVSYSRILPDSDNIAILRMPSKISSDSVRVFPRSLLWMQFGDRNRMDYPTPFNVSLDRKSVV